MFCHNLQLVMVKLYGTTGYFKRAVLHKMCNGETLCAVLEREREREICADYIV